MESDQGKIFVGGISWETTDEKLKEYFQTYGEVIEAVIMKDRTTGRGRGFGFVVFADPDVADRVVQEKHNINGKLVEAKKAVPRDEHQNVAKTGAAVGTQASSTGRTKKIFVGGLAPNVSDEEFRQYFEQFGNITDVVVMYDHATQRPRGFGFITFDSEEAVENVLQKTFHELKDKLVEVKRAVPKDASAPPRSPAAGFAPRGPFGAYGQGYPPYAYGPARGAYPSYAGYGGYGYGTYGYGAGAYSPGAYGAGAGYGNPSAGTAYGPGNRNTGWAAAPSYTAANTGGYGGNGSGYGGTGWGSGSGQVSTASGAYQSYGYGTSESGYAPNAAGTYGARNTGYSNAGGGYAPGNASGGYAAGAGGSYGDAYGYAENTWRADSYGANTSTGPGAGGYGVSGGASSPAPESNVNGSSSGSYGTYGATRQAQRSDLFYE